MKVLFSLHQIRAALVNEAIRMGYQPVPGTIANVSITKHADAGPDDAYTAVVEYLSVNDPQPTQAPQPRVVFDADKKKGDA